MCMLFQNQYCGSVIMIQIFIWIIIIVIININNNNNIYFLLLVVIIIIITNEITAETLCYFRAELVSLAAVFCLVT